MKIIEVKANSSRLSPLQKMGGPKYTNTQLERATNGIRQWKSMPEGMGSTLKEIKNWFRKAPSKEYEIWRYNIDDAGDATFQGKADWDWDKSKSPKDIVYRDDKGNVVKKEKIGSSSSARGPPSGPK